MTTPNQTRDDQKRTGYIWTLLRDLLSVASLGVLLICIHELASPFVRGFNCDDETIRYPHKDSTVSSRICYIGGSGINIIFILALEYQLLISQGEQNEPFNAKLYLRNVYCRLLVWFFGAISSELLTDISKVTAGRLRPHFIDVCKPVIVLGQNKEASLDDYCASSNQRYQYITDYYCSGDPAKIRDTRLSFMSGHSSYSAYSAAFAVFYIQSAMDVAKVGLIKPAIQVLIISASFYTGLTRISDYKHHWQDVLAGLLQGTTVAAVVSTFVWPSIQSTYAKYLRGTSPRVGSNQYGEELNPVSY